MATYKIVNGDYTIQTLNSGDSITLTSALGNAQADVIVDGNLTVTGNTSLTGNLSVSQIFSGNSNVQVLSSGLGGNVTVGVYGTSNVAVFANTGAYFGGVASATGNITGANINTGGIVSATGNVNGGNVNTIGNVTITRDSSVTQPTIRFSDTDTTGLANTVIGAVEWYSNDATTPGARVATAIRSTYTDAAGNAKVEILTGTTTTPAVVMTILPTGNVGVANANPTTTFGVTGTGYFSSTLQAAGNITGGNLITAGLATVTGNIGGGNVNTAGQVSATGNITGGNVITGGGVTAGAAGVTATGNVRGGNIVSDAQITAVGNITGDNLITQGVVTAQGNIIANNFSAGNVVSAAMIASSGNVSATGNVTGANIATGGLVSATGNVNAGAVYTSGQLVAVGNITTSGGFFIGDGGFLSNVTAVSNVAAQQIANGTTVMAVASSNGNIFATINAIGNIMVLYDGGANFTGAVSVTGNIAAANVNTAGNVSATGNINTANLLVTNTANIGTLLTNNINANALTSGTVSSDRLSGTYVIDVTGNVSGTAATVTNATQANITSVGTLTSLAVTGNITSGNLSTTSNISGGNLILSGAIVDSAQLDIQTSAANANIVLTPNGSGNVNIGRMSASGNITAAAFYGPLVGAVTSSTTISATGNITGGNLSGTSIVGTLTTAAQTNITSVGTLSSLSVTGNITGGNILGGANVNATTHTGATVSVTGNITSGNVNTGILSLSGNILSAINTTANITTTANISGGNLIGTVATASQTNITEVGTLGSLSVTGNVTSGNLITSGTTGTLSVNNITHTGTNAVGNIGSASSYFNQVFATATTALYADLAEKYAADAEYTPGTVVSFGGDHEVTQSTSDGDRRVAGVVSANPSYLMNAGLDSDHVAVVALQGRVPCMVTGKVRKGDMMVSAGNGRARAESDPSTGSVIGKALENFDGDSGTIEVVVGRI